LWNCAIACSLVEIDVEKSSRLHLNYIFASLWIETFRNIIFLEVEKQKMSWLVSIRCVHMILHARWVFRILSSTRLHNIAWFCSLFRWTWSEDVYVSTFSVLMFTFWKTFITWHNAWFWKASSHHSVLNNFSSLSRWCYIDALNVILDLITAEYICLVFANIALQVKTSSQLSISILMTWSAFIWQRCDFHCSFVFSWTSRTHTFNFNFIIKFLIHRLIIMLNLFDFRVKCVSLYFSEMNVTSWVWAHIIQMLCALLNVLQIDSVNLL